MSVARRFAVVFAVTIAVAVSALIFYRVGVDALFPVAQNGSSGPASSVIDLMAWAIPLSLVVIELGTIAWAIGGGVQEERARVRGGRR